MTSSTLDYKTQLRLDIDALYAAPPPLTDLLASIQRLTDAYIASTGERPDARQLDRLATLIVKMSESETQSAAAKRKDAMAT